jgi:hypothetical protein|tara:strand:+ start:147 stop:314 length:168 start_codon:yes stop_codon:yes gene_type:complete
MNFFKYLFENYGTDLLAMAFAYIGIISIVLIFFPFKKIVAFLQQAIAIILSVFKR